MFSETTQAKLNHLVSIYPHKRSALIPMLLLAQNEHGYITDETVDYCARALDLSRSDVESTLSFYTMLRRKPAGKYHFLVCTNLSCMLCGSDSLVDTIRQKLGIELGQTTPDGLFSAVEFECLGSCSTAPVIDVNGEFKENLSSSKLEALIDELRGRG